MNQWRGAAACFLLGAGLAQAGLFDGWDYNARLTFQGYTRAETLSNFTVRVTLADGSNGFSYAAMASPADGADLRFASRDGGTELPYEIESWNNGGVSIVWVKVPAITGAADFIWAYWGKGSQAAPAYATNGAAWDAGELGVWHMAQADAADSTTNAFHGTAVGTVTPAAGPVNGAEEFDGQTDYVEVPDSPRFTLTGAFTLSAWIRPTPSTNWQAVMGTYGTNGVILTIATNADNRLMVWANGYWRTNAAGLPDNAWSHVAYTRSGSTGRFYVNGQVTTNIANATAGGDGAPLQIGGAGTNVFWNSRRFDGRIDEVRLSGTDRSSNWVYAAWLNQASNAAFCSVRPAFPAVSNTAASAVSNTSALLGGQALATGGSPVTVWAFWDTQDRGTSKSWANATNLGVFPIGAVTASVAGLTPNTNYYYTFYASNAYEVAWASPSVVFETHGPPVVETLEPHVIGYTNATLTGWLRDGYSADAGFIWGETPDGLTNSLPAGSTGEAYFEAVLTGLENDRTYYGRACASNIYGYQSGSVTSFTTLALGRLWTGGGANNLASNTNNWEGLRAPTNGETVRLDGTSVKNMTWDLSNVVLRSWNQDPGYTGVVTIATRYPGQGPFTNMMLTGNVRIMGGSWTHNGNGGSQVERLCATIQGSLLVGSNGQIQATGKGFAAGNGPGAGSVGSQRSFGASHGGLGGEGGNTLMPRPTYGDPFEPQTLGSSGSSLGGGAIRLEVGGTATILGTISADAVPQAGRHSPGAGGSVLLKALALEGNGLIQAAGRGCLDGTDSSGAGSGGRVAVWLTGSDTFGSVVFQSPSIKDSASTYGACGTVYLKKAGQGKGAGILTIDNQGVSLGYIICTLMPEPTAYNTAVDLSQLEAVVVTNKGILGLNTNTVFDFGGAILRTHYANSTVSVFGTNGLSFPPLFILSTNYTLVLDVPVSAAGDWVIPTNVVLSHHANLYTEAFRLQLTLGGNLTVEAGGQIHVGARGFKAGVGPAAASATQYGSGGGFGGMGGLSWMSNVASRALYGSVTAPTNMGSGAYYAGGGLVILDVAGTTTVAGTLSVSPPAASAGYPNGSGG